MPPPKKIISVLKKAPATGSNKLKGFQLRCMEFIEHYLNCFNATEAARRMGYEGSSASTQGHEFFHNEFTQAELKQRYENQALESKGARREIIAMLYREANNHGLGSSHSARVRAQVQLSKIFGLETIQIDAKVEHGGGVMVVPMSQSIDEWERSALKQQEDLQRDSIDV
jgi:phage terminase small subunit